MIIVLIIIGIIAFIIFSLVFSHLFGDAFRTWNEGEDYDKNKKYSNIKTLIIGFIILVLIMLYYSLWE